MNEQFQNRKILATRLREAREDLDLKQSDVASLMGQYQSFISKIESMDRRVDAVELSILANIYKKPIEWFFIGMAWTNLSGENIL